MTDKLKKVNGKGKGPVLDMALLTNLTWVRLLTRSGLQSRK